MMCLGISFRRYGRRGFHEGGKRLPYTSHTPITFTSHTQNTLKKKTFQEIIWKELPHAIVGDLFIGHIKIIQLKDKKNLIVENKSLFLYIIDTL